MLHVGGAQGSCMVCLENVSLLHLDNVVQEALICLTMWLGCLLRVASIMYLDQEPQTLLLCVFAEGSRWQQLLHMPQPEKPLLYVFAEGSVVAAAVAYAAA